MKSFVQVNYNDIQQGKYTDKQIFKRQKGLKDTQKDKQTKRQKDKKTKRQKDKKTKRQKDRRAKIQKSYNIERQVERWIGKQIERQLKRQIEKQVERRIERLSKTERNKIPTGKQIFQIALFEGVRQAFLNWHCQRGRQKYNCDVEFYMKHCTSS